MHETQVPAARDKALDYYARFDREIRERLRAVIDDALIAEHAAKPLGQHSDTLERVLNYFRRAPQPGKYILVATRPWQEYHIAVISGTRGVPPKILDGPVFSTEKDALHGVFLRRVHDLMSDAE